MQYIAQYIILYILYYIDYIVLLFLDSSLFSRNN
jgi:hypothetical protein